MQRPCPSALARAIVLAMVAPFAIACGAKTGLAVPDSGSNDVGDMGLDAGDLGDMADLGDMSDMDPDMDLDVPCIDVPFDGGPVEISLEVEAVVGRADIVFLIDVTASMSDEIDRIRATLRDRIAPAIREAVVDSHLGVATFADFPIAPYGDFDRDLPFELLLAVDEDVTRVQAAVDGISLGDGQDSPESQVEALFQLATGRGILPWVEPSGGCPNGGRGYACLRTDALPVVLLFTDAPMHNGPQIREEDLDPDGFGGSNAYNRSQFEGRPGGDGNLPASYFQAVEELQRLGARVIGFDSGDGAATAELSRLARDTGAVTSGGPLVFDIGARGQRLSTSVVDAIRTFAGELEQNISATLIDPRRGDGVDPREFVESIAPLSASPPDGIAGVDEVTGEFLEVRSGTLLQWELTLTNDAFVPGPLPQSFELDVVFLGDGIRPIGRQRILLVIPGADGAGCESFES
ncbi:MAG: hypothetical protein AAGH15_06530 [Myxococcota bacterium]